jgi:hypothetical protein
MKILILDQGTKKPLANCKLQLQVRGKDSGFLTTKTDASGYCTLDEKFSGQQIAMANGGAQSQWIQASEGEKLYTTGAIKVGAERQTSTINK